LSATVRTAGGESAIVVLLASESPPSIIGIGDSDTGPTPPGTTSVGNLLEAVGVAIFVALLVSALLILLRRR
jgi:uncharacterized protein (TIGR03382 family)